MKERRIIFCGGKRKMRNKVVILMLGVLLSCQGLAQATNVDFNSVNPIGTIQDGDNYDTVTLHDSAVVTMIGGSAHIVGTNDLSTFQLQGGNVTGWISVLNASTLTMSGGSVGDLQLFDSGIANISGGAITGWLGTFGSTAIVNVYAKSFNNISHNANGWLISGNWDDVTNSPFTILYRGNSPLEPGSAGSPVVLYTIPEPATLSLLCLGILAIRKLGR